MIRARQSEVMRIYQNRQQTPFRSQSQKVDNAGHSSSRARAQWEAMDPNKRPRRADEVFISPIHPDSVISVSNQSMSIDPPSIARATSSSSSLSSTSTTHDFDVRSKTSDGAKVSQTQRQKQSHGHPWRRSYQQRVEAQTTSSRLHPRASSDQRRGMVLASPVTNTPSPALGSRCVSDSDDIGSPPRLYRLTVTSRRDRRSRCSWNPHAIDCRYSDQQLQEMHEQSLRHTLFYHSGYSYYAPYPYQHLPMPQENYVLSGYRCKPEVIGHPALRIYKLSLPKQMLKLLDHIVESCERFAQRRPTGWRTDLYSLTRQDIALMDVPGLMEIAMPIMHYISRCIREVFHSETVKVDRNQPHVLKYNSDHTGVELHHDRCDVTANLMLSRSHTYVGGGTYFPGANRVVRLKYGEFLLHPGQLVHSGRNITAGNRYLMVLFANLK